MAKRFSKLRQRFGIAAPRVAVRTHVAWYWRWLGLMVLLACSAALAAWMYDAGRKFAGFDRGEAVEELSTLKRDTEAMRSELDRLRAIADAADSRLSIERTAQQKLAQQTRTMESENARLREELAIFESMLSGSESRSTQGLSILRFKVEPDVLPGEYRYRLLLLAAGGRRDKDFQGRVELAVSVSDGGKSAIMTFPEKSEEATAFRLAFKHFHRVEGTFRVNPKARVESVQVRVFENGVVPVRATHAATIG
jgi:hypothetical protein